MDTSKLRNDTREVWHMLDGQPALKGFVLIGGTALALHIRHRLSEDLDFAYLGQQLPQLHIDALVRLLRHRGVDIVLDQNAIAVESFLNDGLDLNRYQQNFLVNGGVKLTLVSLDPPASLVLTGGPTDPMRVATLDELFSTKCLVCADRAKHRDWFDVYSLMTQHGYTFEDMYRVFQRTHALSLFNNAALRMRDCTPTIADEGFSQLAPNVNTPTLNDLRDFFNRGLDEFEKRLATASLSAEPALCRPMTGN